MKKRLFIIFAISISSFIFISQISWCLGSPSSSIFAFERSFTFDVNFGQFRHTHSLDVSIPKSLYQYYKSRSHIVRGYADYAKFATPSAFKSIAENIQTVTNKTRFSEEQFANSVLSLVRQINYHTSTVKFPIETLVENSGDCDLLSILAASIMKAGGLDVVILLYQGNDLPHMNVGVHLPYTPVLRSWWIPATGFSYNNKTYWVAESTSDGDWKVGELPQVLAQARTYIIQFPDTLEPSPDQISARLDAELLPSEISVDVSFCMPRQSENEGNLIISGAISPILPNKTVTLYASQDNFVQTLYTKTNEAGKYSFNWSLNPTGTQNIQISCTDISNYTTAESEIITLFGSFENFQEILKSNIPGTGVSLSGEFMLLGSNQTSSQEELKFPATESVLTVLEMIYKEKEETETTESQLSMVMQRNDTNDYKTGITISENQDASDNSTQTHEENTSFIDASKITKENIWYKFEANISETAKNMTLGEENGTNLENITEENNIAGSSKIGILITHNPSSILAFRNLKVGSIERVALAEANDSNPEIITEPPFPEIVAITVPLTITTVFLVKKLIKEKLEKPNTN